MSMTPEATMYLIRRVEERIIREYPAQQIRCPTHLYIGQEAIAAGVCAALRPDDVVFPFYRSHGWYLAKGGNLERLIGELYGREWGCSRGQGGSMHVIDLEAGVMGSSAVVGGMLPQAVGAALAATLDGSQRVCVVPFGDAAVEEGVFHESMNFAALRHLPVVFVCENNGLAVGSALCDRQAQMSVSARAQGYGLPGELLSGNNVDVVLKAATLAVQRARSGQGPSLLECCTSRWREHCGPGPSPLPPLRQDPLANRPLTPAEQLAIDQRIDAAFARAMQP